MEDEIVDLGDPGRAVTWEDDDKEDDGDLLPVFCSSRYCVSTQGVRVNCIAHPIQQSLGELWFRAPNLDIPTLAKLD